MRRDKFRLEVSNVAWLEEGREPSQPTLSILASVDGDTLHDWVGGRSEATLTSDDVDVTFRFRDGADEDDVQGVLALADRVTGQFHLEVDADGAELRRFVSAARRYAERTGETARYQASVLAEGETIASIEKRTLLVYSSDGELLRQHSLIPSGVEI